MTLWLTMWPEIEEVLSGTVLMTPIKYNELRYTVDYRNEVLGRKIRDATGMKIPVQLIVGPKMIKRPKRLV